MTLKTIQVHLNRVCNLACLHCYSRSGPTERESLSLEMLARFLAEARDEGYELVSFSGGEPFLHPQFAEIVALARALGFAAVAITNGTILKGSRLAALAHLDLVAVSVDGPEEVHNRLRASKSAFARMLQGLEAIRAAGLPFGIAHTVTRNSLPHLSWMAAFARDMGAGILQLHPLGLVGAAADRQLEALDGEALARVYLAGLALRLDHGDALQVHIDLFNRGQLRSTPSLVVPPRQAPAGARLADVINPLVLRSDGLVSPICHGLSERFCLADLAEASLAESVADFLARQLPCFHDYASALFSEMIDDAEGWPYLNWYELLEREAGGASRPVAVAQRAEGALA